MTTGRARRVRWTNRHEKGLRNISRPRRVPPNGHLAKSRRAFLDNPKRHVFGMTARDRRQFPMSGVVIAQTAATVVRRGIWVAQAGGPCSGSRDLLNSSRWRTKSSKGTMTVAAYTADSCGSARSGASDVDLSVDSM